MEKFVTSILDEYLVSFPTHMALDLVNNFDEGTNLLEHESLETEKFTKLEPANATLPKTSLSVFRDTEDWKDISCPWFVEQLCQRHHPSSLSGSRDMKNLKI